MKKHNIFIIEDNLIWQERYKKWLGNDYNYTITSDIEEAKNKLKSQPTDIIIQDLGLPEVEIGLSLLEELVTVVKDAKIIVITSSQDHQHALLAQQKGAYSYFYKNENIQDELPLIVKRALKMQQLERDNISLLNTLSANLRFENIISVSTQMQEILQLIEQTKHTRESVLLYGESGVGKEVIARHIHNRSSGKNKPFIAINSAAIPENLLENELFGHEAGAYTGAKGQQKGKFEMAEEGTLFLDEIGELPLSLQAKLLRVLQEKTFFRLGGINEIKANFRLIAATNRALDKEILQANFREDLYYRINVIPITIPPLRERPDDIPALINYFVKKYCLDYGKKNTPILDIALITYLTKLEWKGNIRELENTLKRMLVINTQHLTIKDIPHDIQEKENPLLKTALINQYTMDDLTRMYAHLVYEHVNYNKKEACKILNINYRTLVSRLNNKLH